VKYKIEIISSAVRDLKKLPKNILLDIDNSILLLSENPRPNGYKKLVGSENRYRIKVKDYRILYEIKDEVLTILIVRIRHRRNVYK